MTDKAHRIQKCIKSMTWFIQSDMTVRAVCI